MLYWVCFMRKAHIYIVLSIMLLVLSLFPSATMSQEEKPSVLATEWDVHGPRVDEYLISIITSPDARLLALKKGEIHITGLRAEDIEQVRGDPNIDLLFYQTYSIFAIQINVRRWPLNIKAFRQAMAHLVDREWIIREVFGGYGVPVETFVPPAYGDWYNPDVKTYAYDIDMAKQTLLNAGFKFDEATGKWYDPDGKEVREVELLIPPESQAPWLFKIAVKLKEDADKIHFPLKLAPMEFQAMVAKIIKLDYDMFLLGWALGRHPTYLYDFFRSDGSYNYWGYSNPEVDELLETFYRTTDIEEAKTAAKEVQEILSDELPWIPLYMTYARVGVRKEVSGIVLLKPLGGMSWLTPLNVFLVGQPLGGRFKDVLGSDPRTLNPMTAMTVDEWDVMDCIFDYLFIAHPDDVTKDLPWLAERWEIKEVTLEGGHKGMEVTFYLVKNATWQDGEPFTAYDVNFTLWFIKENKVSRYYAVPIQNLIKTEVPDPYTIKIVVNGTSWAYLYDLNVPIIPKHIWGDETFIDEQGGWDKWDPSKVSHPKVPGLTCLIGTGPFIFKDRKPGEYILLVWNPNYWRRHPGKTLEVSVEAPSSIYSDESAKLSITVKDYTGKPIDANVVVRLIAPDGSVVSEKQVTATGGSCTVEMPAEGVTGDCRISVTASGTVGTAKLSRSVETSITIRPSYERYLPYVAIVVVVIIIAAVYVVLRRGKGKASAP